MSTYTVYTHTYTHKLVPTYISTFFQKTVLIIFTFFTDSNFAFSLVLLFSTVKFLFYT